MSYLEKRKGKWWIAGMDGLEIYWPDRIEDCGPYSTKAEAESDRRGMERLDKHGDKPNFVTVDEQS